MLAGGCGKRQSPVATDIGGPSGDVLNFTHDFGPNGSGWLPASGEGLTLTESPLRNSKAYLPPGYRVRGEGRPYPILYLLQDFGGNGQPESSVDEQYYFELGLRMTADSLIKAGVIRPMIIATVDLYNAYGGSWFASNGVQGSYEEAFLEYVRYTDTALNVANEQGRYVHAVGGVGMGGYGAIMMAMKHPDLFSSASSVNGFLAFTTNSEKYGFNGISGWIPKVFEENFVTELPAYVTSDPAAVLPYYSMTPDIKLPFRKPYTNLIFSMAAAFSPFMGQDSITWMNPALAGGDFRDWKVTLPFIWTGELWPDVFTKWQSHDATRYIYTHPTVLSATAVHVEAGTTSDFGTLEQSRIFRDAAVSRGLPFFEYEEFNGYAGYPTVGRNYLSLRLRNILKFHSDYLLGDYYLAP